MFSSLTRVAGCFALYRLPRTKFFRLIITACLMISGGLTVAEEIVADRNLTAIEKNDNSPRKRLNINLRFYDDPALGTLGEVLAIAQDKQGFMWFGGKNGLARLDGYSIKLFQHNDADPTTISTNTVNDLAVDDQGNLWVATYWGLNRYDPALEHFERFLFDPEKPRGLSHNSVLRLKLTKAGELWVGTEGGGLLRFNPQTHDFDRFLYSDEKESSLSGNAISALEEDAEGHLWVGIKGGGIDVFDPVTQQVVRRLRHDENNPQSLSQNHATSIEQTPNGDMWVGTYYGLNRYKGSGAFERFIADYDDAHSLGSSNINRVMATKEHVWIGTGDKGLMLFQSASNDFDQYFTGKEVKSTTVSALFHDVSGGLWIGFTPAGVARVDRYSAAFRTYQNKPGDSNSLSHTDVLSLAEDSAHNLWVGTRDGLNYLDRNKNHITRYMHDQDEPFSLPSPTVSAVAVAADDSVWAGTSWGGIGRLDLTTQKFRQYMPQDGSVTSLANREAWSLLKDSQGHMWVGTNMGAVHRYRPKTDDFMRYRFREPGKSTSGRALSIDEDDKGDLWLSTDDGLFRLASEYQSLGSKPSDADDVPTESFFEYFAEFGDNVIKPSIPVIRNTFQDSRGNLWIATEGGGVNMWNRSENTYHVYLVHDGLAHNTVSAIVEDEAGFIWMSTGGGISRFNPTTKKFKNFTTEHGLPSDIFSHPAGLKTADGNLAFGGVGGLTVINPDLIFTNTYQAPLVMTAFYLFNLPVKADNPHADLLALAAEDIPEDAEELLDDSENPASYFTLPQAITHTNEITLRHDQSVFTFEFSLLNFDVTEQNSYAYKLEGFDEDWTYAKSRRTATYTNLDSGEYIFHVRAMNNEGVLMTQELSVALYILPPWWATWWAYLLYILAFMAVFFGIIYSQYARRQFVEAQNKLLEEKIVERTKELKMKNEELELAYKNMEDASYSDQLTGLRNRRYFYDAIAIDVAKVERNYYGFDGSQDAALAMDSLIFYLVDIDHFKSVNDHHGHAHGDTVLKKIASALSDACRDSDMVIRWGGEEFLIVCRYVSRASADAMAERLREAIDNIAFELDEELVIQRTCSIGYACYPFDVYDVKAVTMEQTIDIADWCLYKVKNSGRNGWAGLMLNQPLNTDAGDFMQRLDEFIDKDKASFVSNRIANSDSPLHLRH